MTWACAPVDGDAGVVLRLSANAECAAQAIGADGFQAMIGGPLAAGLLSALVTIFVAIIGYWLVLGNVPRFDEGIGRILRLGIVLALVTGWPAFQTLVYRTATDAPEELAATILPAAGLSATDLPSRVQQVYDALRLGANGDPRSGGDQQPSSAQPGSATQGQASTAAASQAVGNARAGLGAMPQTASLFVVVTIGTIASLHLAIGILLALAILALLFDGTLGLFNGWARALVGTALAGLAATIVSVIMLIPIEQEVLRLQGWRGGGVFAVVDPQAVPTLVLASAVAMLVAIFAGVRMGSALRYGPGLGGFGGTDARQSTRSENTFSATKMTTPALAQSIAVPGRDRAAGVAKALALTVRREQRVTSGASSGVTGGGHGVPTNRQQDQAVPIAGAIGMGARRTALRRSRSAVSRDRVGR